MNKDFWKKVGSNLAKGSIAATRGTVTGLVWLGRQTVDVSKETGKAFSEEWKKQVPDKEEEGGQP